MFYVHDNCYVNTIVVELKRPPFGVLAIHLLIKLFNVYILKIDCNYT